MGIQNKIEEIRQLPERQRVKYVWYAVGISMFFLIILWVFSVKDLFNKGKQSISNDNALIRMGSINDNVSENDNKK